jgi:hypothetical protein
MDPLIRNGSAYAYAYACLAFASIDPREAEEKLKTSIDTRLEKLKTCAAPRPWAGLEIHVMPALRRNMHFEDACRHSISCISHPVHASSQGGGAPRNTCHPCAAAARILGQHAVWVAEAADEMTLQRREANGSQQAAVAGQQLPCYRRTSFID